MLRALGFRYSTSREAYVLRLVGNHRGPVYQVQQIPEPGDEIDAAESAGQEGSGRA